ncbi:unnamed protein product [Mytilus coruscus]|uniref:Uncharacterized protein n=1 Tax=Mytilus coruscus TaxID=42192 RepID=A0A6J7ZTZ3_MYTCO|nr:unnamed protein product [Mytilus coruscus]
MLYVEHVDVNITDNLMTNPMPMLNLTYMYYQLQTHHNRHLFRLKLLRCLSSIGGSHSTCFVCRKRGPKLIVVSSSTRLNTFVQKNIIIPAGANGCPGHISDENFSEQALECLSDLRKTTDFNRSDILDLLQKIRMLLLKNDDKRLNFDKDSTLSDAE